MNHSPARSQATSELRSRRLCSLRGCTFLPLESRRKTFTPYNPNKQKSKMCHPTIFGQQVPPSYLSRACYWSNWRLPRTRLKRDGASLLRNDETPSADPHARCCGREPVAIRVPIPAATNSIVERLRSRGSPRVINHFKIHDSATRRAVRGYPLFPCVCISVEMR